MTSEQIWQRYEILGTQVITRDTGKRLGIVSELLVDVDRREVVALGLRNNQVARILPGLSLTTYMYLDNIRQIGDVVLVDSDEVLEDINPDRYSTMINSDVVTENQDPLGRVRGFKFNIESGEVQALVIASIGLPLIPDTVVSTYELPVEEIASTGPSRIVVFEGAEERLVKITEGFIEKLGIGIPEWEQETEGFYAPPTPAENQLGTGEPLRTPMQRESRRTTRPVMESAWDDDRWNEPELEPIPRSRPMEQRRYYEADMEQENWNEGSSRDRYYNQPGYGRESGNRPPYNQLGYEGNGRSEYDQSYDQSTYGQRDYGQRDHDQSRPNTTGYGQPYDRDNEDVWADSEAKPHQAPLNIPEKRKQPEYEE